MSVADSGGWREIDRDRLRRLEVSLVISLAVLYFDVIAHRDVRVAPCTVRDKLRLVVTPPPYN